MSAISNGTRQCCWPRRRAGQAVQRPRQAAGRAQRRLRPRAPGRALRQGRGRGLGRSRRGRASCRRAPRRATRSTSPTCWAQCRRCRSTRSAPLVWRVITQAGSRVMSLLAALSSSICGSVADMHAHEACRCLLISLTSMCAGTACLYLLWQKCQWGMTARKCSCCALACPGWSGDAPGTRAGGR